MNLWYSLLKSFSSESIVPEYVSRSFVHVNCTPSSSVFITDVYIYGITASFVALVAASSLESSVDIP